MSVKVATLSGDLAFVLSGNVNADNQLVGNAHPKDQRLNGVLTTAYTNASEVYKGSYEVTPKVESQKLLTKHKFMADDVNVFAIPYYEVGNNSGGSTVYIGGNDEIQIE